MATSHKKSQKYPKLSHFNASSLQQLTKLNLAIYQIVDLINILRQDAIKRSKMGHTGYFLENDL